MTWRRDAFEIDIDRNRLDMATIHGWLTESYWAHGRSLETVRRSWDAAHVVFGLYHGGEQIGCARVITDYVAVAYLSDVYVAETWRGQGLGRWLVETIVEYPPLAGIRWLLHTRDGHGLYRQLGFEPAGPTVMERPRQR